MRKRLLVRLVTLLITVQLGSFLAHGQLSSTSPLSGVVTDQAGAVVEGAGITVKNNATGATFVTKTASNGTFVVPALNNGTYAVKVSAPGFKQVTVNDVKVDAGAAASVRIALEVGTTNESINVLGGGEVLQTQTANVTTTLVAREIEGLPAPSRDVLVMLTMLPGMNTPGTWRTTTINGFTRSGVNVTIDGINTQEINKDAEFFSYISPRIDSIEEVTVSTATPGAESSGQGSVHIRFVTRQGNNDFHGSVYEYHRNTALNSNYWFNNRNLPPDPDTGEAPRDRILLNQYGFRVGGPIVLPKKLFGPLGFDGHNRAFFFVNHERYRLPDQISRQRTILNPQTQQGIFQYNVVVNNQNQVRQVNLLELAARTGQTPSVDPTVGKLLADIRNSTNGAGAIEQLSDPNLQRFTFSNSSNTLNDYSTVRLDFNLSDKHHLENSYNLQTFVRTIDILNNRDPSFPGFPIFGGQNSTRFSNSTALRSSLSPTIVNEARFGFNGGTVHFFEDVRADSFNGPLANQGGFSLGIGAAGISGVSPVTSISRRNNPIWQASDTLSWQRGSHNLNFGFEFTQVNFFTVNDDLVPSITFGVDANDPANSRMFTAANFPGASSTVLTAARNVYAVLTGRVTAIGATAFLDEKTNQYVYQGPLVQRSRQREIGAFVQDSWRARPDLTLNYGVRWEVQFPYTALNDVYTTTTLPELFGVSGPGNLFKPGVLQGKETEFTPFKKGDSPFEARFKNFAPSVGFAWTPNFKQGLLKRILGNSGQMVLRGGYSVAYNRRSITNFDGNLDNNPGNFITATRNQNLGNLVANNNQLPVLLRETNRLGPPPFPEAPVYPLKGAITNAATILDPHLKVPYGQSWTFGIQREIARDTALEIRYIGTHTVRNLETINFNEVNIVENGFLNEFQLAMANLRTNIAAGRGNTFRYFGPNTGTSPLPIILGYFSGAVDPNVAGSYTSTNFSNSTFVSRLAFQNPNPYGLASDLYNNAGRRSNAAAAGLPVNLFHVNPGLLGGAALVTNGASQSYHGLTLELRRRLSKGLLVQSSYTFAKATAPITLSLRKPRVNGVSTEQLPHAFKADWIYELPFGRGRWLFNDVNGTMNRIIGGWEFHGTARIQNSDPISLGNVRLVGMSRKDLEKALKVRFDGANNTILSLPQDIVDNTIRAFNVDATSSTGYGARGVPTGRYIAPANSSRCIEVNTGDCGGTRVVVYGPWFKRFDLSAVKKTRITERMNFELRAEFLNAFNYANFNVDLAGFANDTFGQVTSAWRDNANTNDPGGRIVQIVARFNF